MKNINDIKEKEMNSGSNKSQSIQEIDKLVELSLLYDFYGELLKENQKHIFEDYILNDLSLSEIADEEGISRQGVHDVVKRCTKLLESYEDKLLLIEKFKKTKDRVNHMKEIANEIKNTSDFKQVDQIIDIANTIMEDL